MARAVFKASTVSVPAFLRGYFMGTKGVEGHSDMLMEM
jgi:hypothetical protein